MAWANQWRGSFAESTPTDAIGDPEEIVAVIGPNVKHKVAWLSASSVAPPAPGDRSPILWVSGPVGSVIYGAITIAATASIAKVLHSPCYLDDVGELVDTGNAVIGSVSVTSNGLGGSIALESLVTGSGWEKFFVRVPDWE